MANNNVQAQEIESLNMKEAFFMKYKKAIMIAVVALIVIIAGVFAYMSQIAGPREDKASTLLGKGQTYFQNEMYEQALNGDGAGYVARKDCQRIRQHRCRQPRQPLCRSLLCQPRQVGRGREEPRCILI